MAFIGGILQEVLKIKKRVRKRIVVYDHRLQDKILKKLLTKAKSTQFGKQYNFKDILSSSDVKKAFQQNVPIFDYDSLHAQWWSKSVAGEEDITWPDKTKFFALTSGTTGAASKRVPITKEMIKAIRKVSIRQMLTIPDFKVDKDFYQKQILMLGGSTALTPINDGVYEGDLTGILQANIPVWLTPFYKPGKQIATEKDWGKKLELIAKEAIHWDIGIACGIPAWYQLLFEEIKRQHKVKHIHEVWPNFNIFIHGGVSFAPYKESFKSYLGKEIYYLETYLASEGFFAFQTADNQLGMQLVLDGSVYFEFAPFTSDYFTPEGNLKPNVSPLLLEEVKEGVDYALIISTCAGTWRYLIGDTVKFISLKDYEIAITGRTKHFLSLCGEHLSVDNMNCAIKKVNETTDANINEFTVCGIPHKGFFAHKWYVGTSKPIDNQLLKTTLDKTLCQLNDDYATERKHALKDIIVEQIPVELFYAFMDYRGKLGGQNKFPRVIKGELLTQWENFLSTTETLR
jgi:acyl-CoA synthetase (AMP-forming)/AMP-acid ligase II